MTRAARVILVTAVLAGVLWLGTFGSFEQEVRMSVDMHEPLPDFRLPVLDAGLFSADTTFADSEQLRGKVALIAFWATWCAPCIAEMPALLALQDEFAEDGLFVLGILHDDRAGAALDWLIENERLDFRTAAGDRRFALANRVGGLPHTLLIDRGGIVRELFLGYRPERDEYLRGRVEELLGAD